MESWFDFSYDPVLERQVDLAHRPLMDLRHTKRALRRYQVIACIRHPYDRLASACRGTPAAEKPRHRSAGAQRTTHR